MPIRKPNRMKGTQVRIEMEIDSWPVRLTWKQLEAAAANILSLEVFSGLTECNFIPPELAPELFESDDAHEIGQPGSSIKSNGKLPSMKGRYFALPFCPELSGPPAGQIHSAEREMIWRHHTWHTWYYFSNVVQSQIPRFEYEVP